MAKQWSWASDEAALKYALPLAAFLLALLVLLAVRHGVMKWLRLRVCAQTSPVGPDSRVLFLRV